MKALPLGHELSAKKHAYLEVMISNKLHLYAHSCGKKSCRVDKKNGINDPFPK